MSPLVCAVNGPLGWLSYAYDRYMYVYVSVCVCVCLCVCSVFGSNVQCTSHRTQHTKLTTRTSNKQTNTLRQLKVVSIIIITAISIFSTHRYIYNKNIFFTFFCSFFLSLSLSLCGSAGLPS